MKNRRKKKKSNCSQIIFQKLKKEKNNNNLLWNYFEIKSKNSLIILKKEIKIIQLDFPCLITPLNTKGPVSCFFKFFF